MNADLGKATVFSLFRRWRRKDHTDIGASDRTPPGEPQDDDMAWFFPPCDVHDYTVWDRYWQDQVTHGLTPPLFDMFCHDGPLIECLTTRGAKTLLCAGNGISQEPRALAAAGFEVIAMDLHQQRYISRKVGSSVRRNLIGSAQKASGPRAGLQCF